MSFLRRILDDQRGQSLVLFGVGFMAILSASLLAIDVGLFLTARSQAQNSADAAALAGAVALVFQDSADRSTGGAAVQTAITAGQANQVIGQNVSVQPADVSFPNDPEGQPTRVQVNVYRTIGRNNPVSTLVAAYFGRPNADISATATAEASPANAATCVKPWAVPDKWQEVQDPPWDPADSFDQYNPIGAPLPDPDVYVPADQSGYTGFNGNPTGPDYGLQITLKAGAPSQAISASHFYPVALPPNTGAAWYEENIPSCWSGTMQMGDLVPVEPGNMTGPTLSGTETLIDQDPNAYWDTTRNRVVSAFNPSPRIIVMPVFDPAVYENGRQRGRVDIQVSNLVGFFVENLHGSSVVGRLVPAIGLIRGTGTVPTGAFLRAIRLVQ
ncbi:MAG: hypothetical protein HYX76_07190 [Acidobacteria bacterium]|nr:hypothetical protein [Acidobacteriota bacterium]